MSHYYDKKGNTAYTVIGANGKERSTTIRDARKQKLLPSVTGVTGIIAKPMLTRWITQETLKTSLEIHQRDDESADEYIKRIMAISKDTSGKAARRGTEIHDKLENYFTDGDIDEADADIIVPCKDLIQSEFGDITWVPEASFGHKLGYGGKVDLYSPQGVIIDFKTKAKDELNSKLLYFDYCVQLAAYRTGLDLPSAKCYNLVISTTKPGTLYLHEWEEADLRRGMRMFKLMLAYWQLTNNYQSGYWMGDKNE